MTRSPVSLLHLAPLLVAAWTLGCEARVETSTPALDWSSGAWVTASEDTVPAWTARVRVPEQWGNPRGDSIVLTVVRIPSAPGSGVGPPIVYLAGGPGGSAIQAAQGHRRPLFDTLRAVGDVLLMDQRGTGASDPSLLCPSGPDAPLSTVGTRENLLRIWSDWSQRCVHQLAGRGIDLDAYETEAAVRDLEFLRRSVGAPRIHLVAVSYGTQLAQAFVRDYPDAVDRVVLAGPEPLDGTLKPIGQTETQLARLDSVVAADPAAREAVGRFTNLMAEVLNSVAHQPVSVPVVDPLIGDSVELSIGDYDLRLATAFSLGDRAAMQRLPALYLAMREGNFTAAAGLVARLRRFNTTAMALTTDCASGWAPGDSAALALAAPRSLLRDAANFPLPELCSDWPHRKLGSAFRRPFVAPVPALFIAGTLDGRTPPENIDRVAPIFPDHLRLLISGGAHDDDLFIAHPEIIPAIRAFLESGAGPRLRVLELPPWSFGFSASPPG